MPELGNWSGTIRSRPAAVVKPDSIDAVVAILTDSQTCPAPVRPAGNYHSTTECAVADGGTFVDMTGLRAILEITNERVRVEAGAIYADVAAALARKGLSFFVNLEIGNVTLGSVATCATKDGAFPGEFGQAGAYVTHVRLVTVTGAVIDVDESQSELLAAIRSSYGTLGIVVEVTLRIGPLVPIAVRHTNYRTEDFLADLPRLRRRKASLALYLFPFADCVTVQSRSPAAAGSRLNPWVWRARNFGVACAIPLCSRFSKLIPVRSWRYAAIDFMLAIARWLLEALLHSQRTLPSDQITRYRHRPRLARFTFSIFAFPADRYAEVLVAYREFCADHYRRYRYRPDLLSVGYHVTRSRHALLSYSWDGDVLTIDPVATGGAEWDRFVDGFNEFCIAHGGKPLLNQTPRLTRAQVQTAFGKRLERFRELRAEWDPDGRLLNAHFRRLFAEAPEESS